ncbi:MAG: hypothetical protein AAB390_03210 [Patescibacteria group bacterium]
MSIFNPGSTPPVDSRDVSPVDQPKDANTLRQELLVYAREHRNELVVFKDHREHVIFFQPSGWQAGSRGRELAGKYQEVLLEERVQEDPESFFTNGTKRVQPESRSSNPLDFLDKKYLDPDEFFERAREYVSSVLSEILANNKKLVAMIESLGEIVNGGLPISADAKNEALRLLRKVRHDEEDSVFKLFLLDSDVLPILRIEDGQKNSDIKQLANGVVVASADTDRLTAELSELLK